MDLKELQIKSAEVLGVSNSQRELAFETFIEKVSESLNEGITLKVPRIGFFQLKTDNKSSSKSIIFSPHSEDFTRETKNLYLTIDLAKKWKNSTEFDSNVFSIGVGKPLLPLTVEELPNTATSFAMLKKSIEERAKELIAESDQIPNFDLFEDYYKFNDAGEDQEKEINLTLSGLSSDIMKVVDPHEIADDEYQARPPEDDFNVLESLLEGTNFPEVKTPDLKEEDRLLDSWVNKAEGEEKSIENEKTHGAGEDQIKDINLTVPGLSSDIMKVADTDEIADDEYQARQPEEDFNVLESLPEGTNFPEVKSPGRKEEDRLLDDWVNKAEGKEKNIENEKTHGAGEDQLLDNWVNKTEGEEKNNANVKIQSADLNGTIDIPSLYPDFDTEVTLAQLLAESSSTANEEEKLINRDLPGTDAGTDDEEIQEKTVLPDETVKRTDPDDSAAGDRNADDKPDQSDPSNGPDTVNIESFLNDSSLQPDGGFKPPEKPDWEKLLSDSEEVPESENDSFSALNRTIEELKISEENLLERSDAQEKKDTQLNPPESPAVEEPVIEEPVIEEIPEGKKLNVRMLLDEEENSKEDDDHIWTPDAGNEEKIEWNWGDELREEFGLLNLKGEDANYEMVDEKLSGGGQAEEKSAYKDLFEQLEKDIEQEKISFETDFRIPENRQQPSVEKPEKKETGFSGISDDEKVYLEFSSPPQKYEFVDAAAPERNKKLSIELEETTDQKSETFYNRVKKRPDPPEEKSDNYFGKLFLIIFSAFLIVSAAVYLFLRSGVDQKQAPQSASFTQQDPAVQKQVDSIIQAQIKNSPVRKDSTGEDLGEFPVTATPPVPLKNDSKKAESETNAASARSLSKPRVKTDKPIRKQTETAPVINKNKVESIKTPAQAETRISDKIYFDGTNYFIQVSSWPSKSKAETEVNKYRFSGVKTFIVEVYLPQKGGKWYRVRIGSFKSEQEARNFINKKGF
jgi:cell division protein FtsN